MSTSPWQVRFSRSKQLPYFFNTTTQESVWTRPEGMSEDEARGLEGGREYLGVQQQQGQQQQGQQQQGQQQQGQQDKVRASHLLIKHQDSRRPASWKNPNITTPKESAIAHLKTLQTHLLAQAQQGDLAAEFARLAARESDCASHAKGGDLGWFGRGSMQKPFEDGTFALEPGQMSGIVDTDSGVHLILRTG